MVTDRDPLERAKALVAEIAVLARADKHMALLSISADSETEELLGVLPERESRQAKVHLHGARMWRARQNEKARAKLQAANQALNELDLILARGILRKIDHAILEPPELARYDELLLAVEARAVEIEDIERRLPPSPPSDKQSRRNRFWR